MPAPLPESPTTVRHVVLKLPGRALLERGTEFSVKNRRGRFLFIEHVVHRLPDGSETEWITGYGGDRDRLGRRQFHSFRPEDVRTVHRRTDRRRRRL